MSRLKESFCLLVVFMIRLAVEEKAFGHGSRDYILENFCNQSSRERPLFGTR